MAAQPARTVRTATSSTTETVQVRAHSSFPIIHKGDNISIFVLFSLEINWKQLRTELIPMQIGIYQGALNSYWNGQFLYITYF